MYVVLSATLLAITLAMSTTPSMANELAQPSASLRAKIEHALKQEGLTGAVWATITPGAGVRTGAAGLKDAATRQPMSERHRVHVGSITKTMLALGVLRLVTQRQLTLDEPVSRRLPELHFDNPWEASDPITIRHLLDHTAGLDDAKLWQVFSLEVTADTPLCEAFPPDANLLKVRARPGSRFSYSNMSYGLLGMVIEAITGERYEHYLNQNLLGPLRMTQSTFSFVSQLSDPRLAMGHFEDSVPQTAVPIHLRPPTQFTTTAADMAELMRFLAGDGHVAGELVIDKHLLESMGRPHMTEAAIAGLSAGYGLGLARRDRHGAIGLCHSGNGVGFRAMLCVYREEQKAFFIAINADSETANYERFNALLIDAIDVTSTTPTAAAHLPDIRAWKGFYTPAPNRFASFAWLDRAFGFVHLSEDGAALSLSSLQSPKKQLLPQGDRLFRAADRTSASHVLLQTAEGTRVLSDGYQNFEQVSWARIALLWSSICLGVLGTAWIVLWGFATALRRQLSMSHPMFIPFAAILALFLPAPLFYTQSFLQVGDMTAASAALAIVTTTLPAGMLLGIARLTRARSHAAVSRVHLFALAAVMQGLAVLAIHGLIPVRLWAL